MRLDRLARVWRGEGEDGYADAAVTGTLAIALKLLGRAGDQSDAEAKAVALWSGRDRDRLRAAA